MQDEFIRISLDSITQIRLVKPDCVLCKVSEFILIPVSVVGGKTRLLRPHSAHSIDLELSITINASIIDNTFRLLESIYEARKDKDKLNVVVSRFQSDSPTPFDLTGTPGEYGIAPETSQDDIDGNLDNLSP